MLPFFVFKNTAKSKGCLFFIFFCNKSKERPSRGRTKTGDSNLKGKDMNIQNLYSANHCQQNTDANHSIGHNVTERAIRLIDGGHFEEADLLASAELLFCSGDAQLWLIAGIARFHKGSFRSAHAAFTMSVWLDDNALAREMLETLACG